MKAATDPDALMRMLTRLKLTAIRDQLDSLLDTATRRKPCSERGLCGELEAVERAHERKLGLELATWIRRSSCSTRSRNW